MAEPIKETGPSILAGCTSSTTIARAYMRDIAKVSKEKSGTEANQHVDDLSHVVIAQSKQEV